MTKDHSKTNAAPTKAPIPTLGPTLRVMVPVTTAETTVVPIEIASRQTKRLFSTAYPIHKTFLFDIASALIASKALLSWNSLPLSCSDSDRKNQQTGPGALRCSRIELRVESVALQVHM